MRVDWPIQGAHLFELSHWDFFVHWSLVIRHYVGTNVNGRKLLVLNHFPLGPVLLCILGSRIFLPALPFINHQKPRPDSPGPALNIMPLASTCNIFWSR